MSHQWTDAEGMVSFEGRTYAQDVARVAHEAEAKLHEMLASLQAQNEALRRQLEQRSSNRRGPRPGHCYGLPRVYPKMWMRRPESNSLWTEIREWQRDVRNKD